MNVLGWLALGVLAGLFQRHQPANPDLTHLFIICFCGDYTTFSAFAPKNLNLFQSGNSMTAFLYMLASVTVCLLAVWLGPTLAQ